MLRQDFIHLSSAFMLKELVQMCGQGAQFFLLKWSFQQQPLLFYRAIHQHQYQVCRKISNREHFKVLELPLSRTWRCHDGSAMQQTRHHRSRQAYPLIQLILYLVELMTDEPLFIERKCRLLHEMLYKIAVSQVCGHTPRRGMRLVDQMSLFQTCQFMPNRGRAEIKLIL